jgi:hypothetical protein
MNTPQTPNAETPQAGAAPAAAAAPSSWGVIMGGFALIPLFILIAFHVGAGYLSYQKYGSILWAFLDFIFAYFYYPYYAFFLAKDPGPSMGMVGGRNKSLAKLMLGKWFK